MTCEEAREAFTDLHDGRLTGAPLADLDRHLGGCEGCRREWDMFLKTVQAMSDLGSAEPSPGFAERIRAQIEGPPWWWRLAHRLFYPPLVKLPLEAVAVVLVVFGAVAIFQRSPEMQRAVEVRRESRAPAPPRSSAPAGPAAGSSAGQEATGKQRGEPVQGEAGPAERRATDSVGERKSEARPPAGAGSGAGAPEKDRIEAFRKDVAPPRLEVPAPPPAAPAGPQGAVTLAQPPPPPVAVPRQQVIPSAPAPLREDQKAMDKIAGAPEAEKAPEPALKNAARDADAGAAGRRLAAPPADARAKTAAPAPPMSAAAPPAVMPAPAPQRAEEPAEKKEGLTASLRSGTADELYSTALTEYARQGYDRAVEGFRAFVAQYPRDARVADARFWLADSLLAQQRYAEAIPEFEVVVRQFPESRRAPAALLKQAQARLALGDPAGCQALRDLPARYPRTREAAQAREAAAARCP